MNEISQLELLNKIRIEQGNLPAAQRLVAAYVVENYRKIPFLTITELSKNIGVSEYTVIKFCKHFGFKKFTELKRLFSEYAHSELVISNRISQNSLDTKKNGDSWEDTMQESIVSIRTTMSIEQNHENLPILLNMIKQASHIYITGGRISATIADMFVNKLRFLNLRVHELTSHTGDYIDQTSIINKEDLIIAIAFPRYTARIVESLRELHQIGIPIALITDTGLSPAYSYADVVFQCDTNSGSYFPCYTGCITLIDAICREVSNDSNNNTNNQIRQMEQRLLNHKVFI